jgi:hypothetical protein
MLTRGDVTHAYHPQPIGRVRHDGVVRVAVVNSIPQSWAIARPGSSLDPNGAPLYLTRYPQGQLYRGGVMPIQALRPRVEMDPSDNSTWQRPYVFS